jgi:ABC-type multidrug transport system ATPase subunit
LSLIVDQISKRYGEIQALTGVSFTVDDNMIFGLIGPDGAGKTTLYRIIATLLLPDSGVIRLNDHDVVREFRKIRKLVGYMPGRFSLYQDLTVEENLAFYARVFGTTIQENYYLIKDIYSHIEPFRKRRAGNLSGGMKQKLALSCALIHRPQLLILDEPTTGVDAVSRKEFWEMLGKLKEYGITILVSTAYMDEAERCDIIALIQQGKILSVNHPEAIIQEYKRELCSIHSDDLYRLVIDLRSYPMTNAAFLFGQQVHFNQKDGQMNIPELEKFLISRGHMNVEIVKIKPGIEDCFVDLETYNR